MTMSAEDYNQLPLIEDAANLLDKSILASLTPIFARQPKFGVTLVHRHCDLDEGERMVARTSDKPEYHTISEPLKGGEAYPCAWLSDGTPFEYNETKVDEPPAELLEEFRNATAGTNIWNGIALLGLRYVGEPEEDSLENETTVDWEVTMGRGNYTQRVKKGDNIKDDIETCWIVRKRVDAQSQLITYLMDSNACCRMSSGAHIQCLALASTFPMPFAAKS